MPNPSLVVFNINYYAKNGVRAVLIEAPSPDLG
nr:MAG TPA: hypothetical protein [Caudoviricetes sp.]